MKLTCLNPRTMPLMWVLGALLLVGTTGCGFQTSTAGQTLPSAYYLTDDIEFFPRGSETQLPNLRAAIAEYQAQREAVASGMQEEAPEPAAP